MKQILQNLKTGKIDIAEIPKPAIQDGCILIQNCSSLISAGTEKMLLDFGRASLLGKAQQQPEKVKQVLYKIQQEGLIPTLEAVFTRLDEPMPLGYSSAGIVCEVGNGVHGFSVGDRVISNGPHAEFVCVPQNLCAHIPDSVSFEEACFTVLGAIAIQGIRLLSPTIGETFVVLGLGIIGQLTAQILKNSGMNVIGMDLDKNRTELASSMGIDTFIISNEQNPIDYALSITKGIGVDGVVITASTKSNQPIKDSASMCRKRGRIILVGVAGIDIPRHLFYEKELTFQVSCSYGPGRYDENYETKGQDYPLPYVRWTEKRNFEALLGLMANKRLDVIPLISDTFSQEKAGEAYQKILSAEKTMGVVLTYATSPKQESKFVYNSSKSSTHDISVGIIGAGIFAKRTLLPILQKQKVNIVAIASAKGVNAHHASKKYGLQYATSNYKDILEDDKINTVFITTQNNLHAKLICESLAHGKHVFVEKPLCINEKELLEVESYYQQFQKQHLMVGFNRRFAPHIQKIKSLLPVEQPMCLNMTVNSGYLPSSHWLHDKNNGGGRIIGEGCHYIDLLLFLSQSEIETVYATSLKKMDGDDVSLQLTFANGSIGTVHYWSNGAKSFPKEKLEIFSEGKILVLDNFKKLQGYGFSSFRKMNLWSQDKGHKQEMQSFFESLSTSSPCIAFSEIKQVTRASFAVMESVATNKAICL